MINLSETYTYEGHRNWQTGKQVTAQRKIKTGDTVKITFLGASEENIHVEEFNGCSFRQSERTITSRSL